MSSLGSCQFQYTFQVGLAHSGPVIITMVRNKRPSSAEDIATMSHFRALVRKNAILAIKVPNRARKPTHAADTWK